MAVIMRKITALCALFLILTVVNWSIYQKEQHLKDGAIVYVKLAPVDPRSLMQGDYMALRFQLANDVRRALREKDKGVTSRDALSAQDGFVSVNLNKQRIASFKSLEPLSSIKPCVEKNEMCLHYRVRNGLVKLATNAFFFQEGKGALYENARYGQFRIDENGEMLLSGMYDENLHPLGPSAAK